MTSFPVSLFSVPRFTGYRDGGVANPTGEDHSAPISQAQVTCAVTQP